MTRAFRSKKASLRRLSPGKLQPFRSCHRSRPEFHQLNLTNKLDLTVNQNAVETWFHGVFCCIPCDGDNRQRLKFQVSLFKRNANLISFLTLPSVLREVVQYLCTRSLLLPLCCVRNIGATNRSDFDKINNQLKPSCEHRKQIT